MARKTLVLTSLGIISLISPSFSSGLVVGYITGRQYSSRLLEGKTKIRPLIFSIRNWKIHLHHWFLALIILICIAISGKFSHFSGVVYGILGGLIIQDIYWDTKLYKKHPYWKEKWYKIVTRRAHSSVG
ncbi:hypothetical protein DRN75_03890 [Nanoarchaeota archaeon]|nr:MAG: hypothetical protein DRN75_03890 [Nanoarchaeota archaeon]